MSNSIRGKGKQRNSHGHDLNSNAMSMGGGQMAMPPNGATFATPVVPVANHVPGYPSAPYGVGVDVINAPHMSGPPTMIMPAGTNIQHEQPSQYAMQGPPQNMRNVAASGINPNMQWTGVPTQSQQPQMMPTHNQMGGQRGGHSQQQPRQPYPQQQQQQPQMGYFNAAPTGYIPYMAAPVYSYPTQDQAYQQAQFQQQQQLAAQQQYQYNQMMSQQQQQNQHMQSQPQHQTGGGGVPPPMQMSAPSAQQQQQQGGGGGGVPPNQQQQQQSMQHGGGVPPVSGAQSMHHQGGVPPVSAPTQVAHPNGTPYIHAFRPPPQQEQQRPVQPPAPKKKMVLAIVNPETNETVNQSDLEASKKEVVDAPVAEKEEAKGTDETDHAVPPTDLKKQFAEQMLEQSNKPDQSAPAPTPVTAPSTAAPKKKNILFSLDQLEDLGLDPALAAHAPSAPTFAPSGTSGPSISASHPAAAPVVVEEKKKEEIKEVKKEKETTPAAASEYLPAPLPEPAYPNNYKEQQAKQSSPNTTLNTTLAEMPAANHEEHSHPDGSHLLTPETTPPHEEPASSSSEKNTSNDSAICVQTPITPTTTTQKKEKKDVVVVEDEPLPEITADESTTVEEEREDKMAEQEEDAEELTSKLEQLVIVEPSSQDEADSEPSTPAPVTPSVSETTALAEEDEDAEKAAAAEEEAKQQKRAELEAAIAANMEDTDQFLEEIGRYNREYLYNVRDIEKLFAITDCPITSDQLKNYGICRSQVSSESKKNKEGQGGFMPSWGQRQGGGGGPRSDRKAYTGRQSEQHHRGGGGGGGPRQGSNKKLPPSIRPSIERRVDTNVQLHKAEKAWKPEKVTETDLEDEEVKKKLLLKNIRALFNKITPTTKDALINEFLDYKVYQSPSLKEVISVIFDKAVEEPKFCPLYSSMCNNQVAEELKLNNNVSEFRNAILARAQETFTTKTLDDFIKEKEEEIDAETDDKKKKEKQIELLEAKSKFRRRKFGNITFIGQLYLHNLISVRIIIFCVVDLLKSVTDKPADLTGYEADEESVDCAVRLLETIGKRLHDNNVNEQKNAAAAAAVKAGGPKTIQRHPVKPAPPPQATFPLDVAFQTLEGAIGPTLIVSSRIKFMIMNLVELRKMGWVPRKGTDAGPKRLDEIKNDIKKEAFENQQQQQAYERKQSRQEGGGRGQMGGGGGGGYGGGGGGGGHHGGHGGNPKRQIIGRNSSDRGTMEERRTQAVKSSNLVQTRGPPQKKVSLSSAAAAEKSLGGKSGKWSGGASGGSENSKKEDRAAAIQSTNRFLNSGQRSSSSASMKGAEDEGASASGNATQVNSEDEREQNEQREKQEADVTKKLIGSIGDYTTGEIQLDEARDDVLNTVGMDKFFNPSLQTVSKCFMNAAIKKASANKDGFETASKSGYMLAYSLLKKSEEKDTKGRDEILKGVADSCKDIVEQELWEDAPKIWDIVAEVLIHAHVPEEGIFEGAHPTLVDFKDAFLNAAKDSRKPYTLFILVLKRLAEVHYKRDKDGYLEVLSWVLDECKNIIKPMEESKLNKALTETKTSFEKNLHELFRQN